MNVEDDRYYAKKLGFGGHGAIEDWIKAEAEIDAMLHDRIGKPKSQSLDAIG